jgi:hypothetical protein
MNCLYCNQELAPGAATYCGPACRAAAAAPLNLSHLAGVLNISTPYFVQPTPGGWRHGLPVTFSHAGYWLTITIVSGCPTYCLRRKAQSSEARRLP